MRSSKAKEVALTGMLFALAMALSYLESLVTPMLGLLPGMKLGLANIVVMYALLCLRGRTALLLVLLKAMFGLLSRGPTAGFLSLCGGLLSFVVLWAELHMPFEVTGYIFSVSGAVAHNLGQLMGAAFLLSGSMALGYAPAELVAGLVVGCLTCVLSTALFPALERSFPVAKQGRAIFKNKNNS